MNIKVTQAHIEKGKRCNDWQCPIALAIIETDKFWNVSVGDEEIILNDKKFTAPNLVKNFVFNFDQKLPVKPFEFVIVD